MYAAVGKSIPTGMWNNTVCTEQWVILYLNNTWNNMYAAVGNSIPKQYVEQYVRSSG